MTAEILKFCRKPDENVNLRCEGCDLVFATPRQLTFYFSRPVTEDEMRFFEEVVSRAAQQL